MSNTLRPPSFRSEKWQNVQPDFKPSQIIIDDGNLCGIYTKPFKSRTVRHVLFVAALAACVIKVTVTMGNEVIAEATEPDLQAALTNVVQPLQAAALLESRVECVPSYWYSEEAGIVCQVGEYCIRLDSTQN